ncbi:nuclease-related domain-containing protein [Microbacterium sp. STN6]|uniref:nuclease-related domain-containing protein n=1 Tax=Microbacterium sp. STN6 TaxID=2995588 RepID=UPI002260C6C5|nr:nuclease-related domain-containing protein [Microbacterium sp. STN6]MCX7522559.1 nuclease-related domain-containing protein [Microbacterium sp. STN6]
MQAAHAAEATAATAARRRPARQAVRRRGAATLRERPPASAVIAECLSRQSAAVPRTRTARFFGRTPLHPEARSWYAGAIGELHVAQRLSRLGPDWSVLHSVPVGRGSRDIDHIAIGPAGVFTMNAKFHDGARVWVGHRTMLVNGQPTDHIRNSRHEGSHAAKLLSDAVGTAVPVQPLVVLVGSREITFKQRPKHVTVLSDRALVGWLRRQRPVPGFDAAGVRHVAEHPSTWHVRGADAAANPDLATFAALRREVATARRTRGIWGAGVIALSVLACWAIVEPALGSALGW